MVTGRRALPRATRLDLSITLGTASGELLSLRIAHRTIPVTVRMGAAPELLRQGGRGQLCRINGWADSVRVGYDPCHLFSCFKQIFRIGVSGLP